MTKCTYTILYYLATCQGCQKQLPEREMTLLFGRYRFCADCLSAAQKEYAQTCVMCGGVYYAKEYAGPCNRCFNSIPEVHEQKLKTHNRRAVKAGKPATLTVDEWMQTLADFDFKCAYCLSAEYEVLEHFIPVEKAGTTAKNCIPACQSCNIRKRQDRTGGIPQKELARVANYLNSRTNDPMTVMLESVRGQNKTPGQTCQV